MIVTENIDGTVLKDCTLEDYSYQIEPYIGCEHYCYYCYVLNQAATDWTKEVLTYKDIEERLSEELAGVEPQTVYMGWQTDPYQPCEKEYGQTRRVLEVLLERGFSASILTKSDLVLRDLDLLGQMPDAGVSVSVTFTDDHVRGLFEYNTIGTERRIAALAKAKAAGLRTGSLICPIIPYVSDPMDLVDKLEPYADRIWLYGLSILDESEVNWLNIKKILAEHMPESMHEVEAAALSREHVYWEYLRRDLTTRQEQGSANLLIHI